MDFDDTVLSDLTNEVWTGLIGLEARHGDTAVFGIRGPELRAKVDISGAWSGTLSLRMSSRLATRLAARMLARTELETSPAHARDVLGELAHVLAGNVKAVLPGPSLVSMPRVDAPTGRSLPPPDDEATRLSFVCDGHSFSVTVDHRPDGTGER